MPVVFTIRQHGVSVKPLIQKKLSLWKSFMTSAAIFPHPLF
jgi:hypothetical protein